MGSFTGRSFVKISTLFLQCAVFFFILCLAAQADTGNQQTEGVLQANPSELYPQSDDAKAQRFRQYIEDALNTLYEKHDPAGAAAIFRTALVVNPRSPEVYYALSQIDESPQDIINDCQMAMDNRSYLNPAWAKLDVTLLYVTDARLYVTLGLAYKKLGQYDQAKYYLDKVIQDNTSPRRVALAYMHLGEIARQEKPQQSIALITQGRQMFRELKDRPDVRSAGWALWQAQFEQYVQMMKEWNSLPDVYGNPWLLFCKVLSYVIFCFLLRELALIRGRGDADLAWIPLVQWGLLCDMAGLPWILMFLTGVFFISGIGFFLFMLVKIYFLLALLIALRQPLWPLLFPLTGLPLLDLFYWIVLVIERKHETYHTTSDS